MIYSQYQVDPSKIEKGENVQQNMLHLRETAEKISNHIFDSTDTMPAYVLSIAPPTMISTL